MRLRRSVLFVPAANPRMVEKARGLDADVVVLDLEDALAPAARDAARAGLGAALKGFGRREMVVRINPPATPDGQADLEALRGLAADAILLPKVEAASDVMAVMGVLPLWAMIETPLAVLNAAAIATAGAQCLVLGANDLLAQMRARPLPDRRNLWTAMSQTVLAARAHGLDAIDAVHNDLTDAAGFAEACAQARAFGFDGKSLIHPGQIAACNRAFTPTAEELARARRILAAFAGRPDAGAIALDGAMVERLHADEAARIVALDAALAERG